jgi:hypothetical protein
VDMSKGKRKYDYEAPMTSLLSDCTWLEKEWKFRLSTTWHPSLHFIFLLLDSPLSYLSCHSSSLFLFLVFFNHSLLFSHTHIFFLSLLLYFSFFLFHTHIFLFIFSLSWHLYLYFQSSQFHARDEIKASLLLAHIFSWLHHCQVWRGKVHPKSIFDFWRLSSFESFYLRAPLGT